MVSVHEFVASDLENYTDFGHFYQFFFFKLIFSTLSLYFQLGIPNSERLLLERLWAEDNCDMKPPRYDIHGQPLTTSIFSGDQTDNAPARFRPTPNSLHYSPKPGGQTLIKQPVTNNLEMRYSDQDKHRKTDIKSTTIKSTDIKITTDNSKKYNYSDNNSDNNNSTNNAAQPFFSTTASDSNKNSMKSTTNNHFRGSTVASSDITTTTATFTSQNKRQSSDDFVFDETDEALDNLLL